MSELPAVVEVDARGRVQIPLSVRKALGIKSGDFVYLKIEKVPESMIIGKSGAQENPLAAPESAIAV